MSLKIEIRAESDCKVLFLRFSRFRVSPLNGVIGPGDTSRIGLYSIVHLRDFCENRCNNRCDGRDAVTDNRASLGNALCPVSVPLDKEGRISAIEWREYRDCCKMGEYPGRGAETEGVSSIREGLTDNWVSCSWWDDMMVVIVVDTGGGNILFLDTDARALVVLFVVDVRGRALWSGSVLRLDLRGTATCEDRRGVPLLIDFDLFYLVVVLGDDGILSQRRSGAVPAVDPWFEGIL